jgi:hypothetical protein
MANEDNPASIFFDTNGVELPAPAGAPSPAVLTVQGILGGTPIAAIVSAGTDRTATGAITNTQNVEINTQASGACGVQISGVWTGTIVFEATVDGAIWNPVLAVNSVTDDEVTQTTANGNWIIACAGFQKVRARGNTVTSGSATVFLNASTCPQVVTLGGSIPEGSATIGGVEVRDGANQLDVNASGQAAIQDPPNLDVALSTRLNTLGQKPMATSAPVVIASDQSDVPISAASLPLPAGAATSANQTNGTQLTRITDGTDTALVTAAGALVVDASSTIQPVSGTVTADQGSAAATAGAWPTKITDGVDTANVTAAGALQVDGSAVTQPISAVSLPLPTGAATEATLATRATEATLATRVADATVTARLNTLGQKLMVASAPVVIASDQSTLPVSVAALPLPTGAATAANQTTLGNQTTKINDGTNTAAVTAANALKVDGSAVTQPISAASLPLPTGAATEATLLTRATEATLATRAAAAQLPAALVGGRLDTNTGAWLGSTAPTVGQKAMVDSIPVVIASDQEVNVDVGVPDKTAFTYGTSVQQPVGGVYQDTAPTLAAAESGAARLTQNRAFHTNLRNDAGAETGVAAVPLRIDPTGTTTQPVSAASLPLPTGAATEATLLTRVADATVTARLNTLGQKLMAASAPVVLASDQSSIPITAASLPLPAGAATSANQTTLGNQTSKINDGTNTATVKAASTAAVATDTALVVAISPNNSVAVTTTPPVVGTHANAWNAAAVLANGVSASIDCQYTPNISVFGNVAGGASTITVQFSQDDTNFYDATSTVANGDFSVSGIYGARYIRLKSSAARTITATIAGKG